MLKINGTEVLTTLEELVEPRHTALLLIDIQNDYVENEGYFGKAGFDMSAVQSNVPRVRRVLQSARKRGVLIVHVQMTMYPDFRTESGESHHARLLRTMRNKKVTSTRDVPLYCSYGTWGWQIVDDLAPRPEEVVVKKFRASAFIGTNLDLILRSKGIKSVVVVGDLTQGCVQGTANDAQFFDYYPVILRDCVAGYDKALHDAALLIMAGAKDVVESAEVLKLWKGR